MTPTRRAVVAGGAALALLPGAALAAENELRAALDRAVTSAPAEGLALLAGFDAATLTEGARLDLETARAGLAADVELARFGRAGRSPWRATGAAGGDAAAVRGLAEGLAADAARRIRWPRVVAEKVLAGAEARRTGADPALAAALDALAATLRGGVAEAPPPGMLHLPNGRAWYAALLRRQGAAVTPEAAERRIAAEHARLTARAATLFAAIGDRRGSVGERYARLWRDPRWLYPGDAGGRAAAVKDMNGVLATIRTAAAPLFGAMPDVAVRGMSAAEDAAARQGYRVLPTPDAPGAYVVELRRVRDRPRWSLPSVVAHETLPGHLLHLPREAAARPHPLRLEYAAAFGEGWAIFAEALAMERGWLGRDPRVELGHIHWLLFRTGRALADLAVHWHGTPVATVRAKLVEWQGEPAYFLGFDADLDRLVLDPVTRAADTMTWLTLADAARRQSPAALPRWMDAVLRDGRRRDDALAAL